MRSGSRIVCTVMGPGYSGTGPRGPDPASRDHPVLGRPDPSGEGLLQILARHVRIPAALGLHIPPPFHLDRRLDVIVDGALLDLGQDLGRVRMGGQIDERVRRNDAVAVRGVDAFPDLLPQGHQLGVHRRRLAPGGLAAYRDLVEVEAPGRFPERVHVDRRPPRQPLAKELATSRPRRRRAGVRGRGAPRRDADPAPGAPCRR